jgi:alpha-N-arabinofuranosidase
MSTTGRTASGRAKIGRILTAEEMNAHNTFDKPNTIEPAEFKGIELKDGIIRVTLLAKSATVLSVQ